MMTSASPSNMMSSRWRRPSVKLQNFSFRSERHNWQNRWMVMPFENNAKKGRVLLGENVLQSLAQKKETNPARYKFTL